MLNKTVTTVGFVPTLEALPLIYEYARSEEWRFVPCASYGRVIRLMLAGILSSGLVPLEIFLAEIVSRPAVLGRWCVPTVLSAAPMELVVSQRIMKSIQAQTRGKAAKPMKGCVVGIESRHSLARYQFVAWQKTIPELKDVKPAFKMLPMELMHKALTAENIDAFNVPTPWGSSEEAAMDAHVVADFSTGRFAQEVVLCCNRDAMEGAEQVWKDMPLNLARGRRRLDDARARDEAIQCMVSLGSPRCDADACAKSGARHLPSMTKNEFTPDESWLSEQIEHLTRLIPQLAKATSLNELAKSLCFC